MRRMASSHRQAASEVWILLTVVLVFSLIIAWGLVNRPTPRPDIKQRAQFHSLEAALALVNSEFNGYPPSDANDPSGKPYCGAMKLAEAMMGQDLLGFHSKSVFRRDGLDATGVADLYPDDIRTLNSTFRAESLKERTGPFLPIECANAFRLADIYGKGKTGPFPEDAYVLCDTYTHKRPSGRKTGMPILYYRASRLGRMHRAGDPNNIYHCADNQALIALGVPGDPNKTHPLMDPNRFYLHTQDHRDTSGVQPYRRDSYILISAGRDGRYGTADDIFNFEWKYRQN